MYPFQPFSRLTVLKCISSKREWGGTCFTSGVRRRVLSGIVPSLFHLTTGKLQDSDGVWVQGPGVPFPPLHAPRSCGERDGGAWLTGRRLRRRDVWAGRHRSIWINWMVKVGRELAFRQVTAWTRPGGLTHLWGMEKRLLSTGMKVKAARSCPTLCDPMNSSMGFSRPEYWSG